MASEIKVDTISEKTSANGITIDGVNIKDSEIATAGSVPLTAIDIDGGTDIGAAIVDADLFIIDDGAGGTNRKTTASRLKTYVGGPDPSSADGDSLGTASAEWSDLYLADGGVIYFGNDQEITLTHVADDGLILKHVGTGDGKEPSLTFQAGDNDIAQDDVLGSIFFQAPDEGAGTDAILVAAGIEAVSEGDFSSSNNATKLSFKTAASEAASEKMSLSSTGLLTVTGGVTMTGTTPTLTIGDAGAEDTKIVFDGNAQDYHIGLDDTDDDFKIGLGSTLGTTAHIVIDEAGHITKPLQSAFWASGDGNGGADVDTTNGAQTVSVQTVERFDQNADHSSGTFTAPVTGKYLIGTQVYLNPMTGSANSTYFDVRITTSNTEYAIVGGIGNGNSDGGTNGLITLCDMDANDTAICRIYNNTTDSEIKNNNIRTNIWGYLAC